MEQCSIQSYETLHAPPGSYALFDCFVLFRGEIWGIGYVGETHIGCDV
jgi:hypothetical protein